MTTPFNPITAGVKFPDVSDYKIDELCLYFLDFCRELARVNRAEAAGNKLRGWRAKVRDACPLHLAKLRDYVRTRCDEILPLIPAAEADLEKRKARLVMALLDGGIRRYAVQNAFDDSQKYLTALRVAAGLEPEPTE
jgi:hypothetical protein